MSIYFAFAENTNLLLNLKPALVYSKDSDSQSSTTKSGINTQYIIIKDEAEQLKRTGKTVQEEIAAIKTDITTESAQSQSGKLENRFNKDDVQKELDFQREVTEKFGPNVAEADGKNHFSTGSITHSDIENHSSYKGSSIGISAKGDANGGWTGQEKNGISGGVGYGRESDNQDSVTKSGINTQNIEIRNENAQQARTGKSITETLAAIKTDISTDNAESQSGKLENRFDKNALQKELNIQVEATKGFVQTASAAGNAIANKLGEEAVAKQREAQAAQEVADRAYKANPSKENETALNTANQNLITANNEADKWQTGGEYKRKIDGAMNAISAVLGGLPAGGIVTSALSPEINHQIKLATEGSPMANKVAHAVWGAVEAYSANQNAAAGAGGALAGEVMADVIAKELYGKKPNQLNREEKEVVSSVSQAAGALVGGAAANSSQGIGVGLTTAKNAVENNLLSKQDDEIVYHLSEKLRKKGYLTKAEQELLANKLLRDSFVDKLLLDYQENSNKLSDTQKKTLTDEIHRIASSYGISADVLFKRDLRNIIKRDDTEAIIYLSRNNNFERQFMYTSQDAWETVPAIGMGINIAGKAIGVAPKLVTTMEKYPLLTEMGVTAITNTAYQLTNKNTYDPYDLLKAEMSTVLSKDKKLWQQAYLNAGLNVLSTKDPNDYGWSALAGVTGTVASKMAGNTKNISIIRNTSPVISGVASEYYGDSDRLKEWYKRAEEKYAK